MKNLSFLLLLFNLFNSILDYLVFSWYAYHSKSCTYFPLCSYSLNSVKCSRHCFNQLLEMYDTTILQFIAVRKIVVQPLIEFWEASTTCCFNKTQFLLLTKQLLILKTIICVMVNLGYLTTELMSPEWHVRRNYYYSFGFVFCWISKLFESSQWDL